MNRPYADIACRERAWSEREREKEERGAGDDEKIGEDGRENQS